MYQKNRLCGKKCYNSPMDSHRLEVFSSMDPDIIAGVGLMRQADRLLEILHADGDQWSRLERSRLGNRVTINLEAGVKSLVRFEAKCELK